MLDLADVTLEIRHGFSYVSGEDHEQPGAWNDLLTEKETALQLAMRTLNSLSQQKVFQEELIREATALYPNTKGISFSQVHATGEKQTTDSLYTLRDPYICVSIK